MLTLNDLNGRTLKSKIDKIDGAARRWHNNNKNGGNFGINLDINGFNPSYGGMEITGNYSKSDGDKVLTSLEVGARYRHGYYVEVDLEELDDTSDLYDTIKGVIQKTIESEDN